MGNVNRAPTISQRLPVAINKKLLVALEEELVQVGTMEHAVVNITIQAAQEVAHQDHARHRPLVAQVDMLGVQRAAIVDRIVPHRLGRKTPQAAINKKLHVALEVELVRVGQMEHVVVNILVLHQEAEVRQVAVRDITGTEAIVKQVGVGQAPLLQLHLNPAVLHQEAVGMEVPVQCRNKPRHNNKLKRNQQKTLPPPALEEQTAPGRDPVVSVLPNNYLIVTVPFSEALR